MVEPLVLLSLVPSTDQIISTAARASARIRGLKRGRFGCKRDQLQFCFLLIFRRQRA